VVSKGVHFQLALRVSQEHRQAMANHGVVLVVSQFWVIAQKEYLRVMLVVS
jgi:hypothetical protein